jgi:hypothetical protein
MVMASNEKGTGNSRKIKIINAGFAVILILATLTSAYSVWQAARYAGSSSRDMMTSNGMRTESNKYYVNGLLQEQVDVGSWLDWASAASENNTRLARFIEERFRDEFKPAFYAWLNSTKETDGIPAGTPFSMPEYQNANIEKSRSIDQQIEQLGDSASQKSNYASRLTLMTVLTAAIIVICGFESRMRVEAIKLPLLLTVVVIYIFALSMILQVPPIWAF